MDNLAKQIQRQRHQKVEIHKEAHEHVKKSITKGEKIIISAAAVLIMTACFFIISNFAAIYGHEREISSLSQSVSQQSEVNQSLEVEISELSAPDRIMYYAKEELGMTLQDDQVKVIQSVNE